MSTLLEQASLVMIPSGYKEDTVYSVVPSDGSGDLAFTRASNGTRINSAGLVEVTPWNLLEQSNSFNTTWAIGTNTTLTSGFSDPFGGGNAWRLTMTSGAGTFLQQTFTFDAVAYTFSVWAKANGNTNLTLQISGSSQESYVLTNEWQRITFTYTPTAGASQVIIGNGILSVDALIYGAQLNIGSTAKPYFPTTDRLNVPRLTYQNGGGGCPSLLLEPQRTNLALYSQEFDNASWAKGNATVTANYAISPDGTTNADKFIPNTSNSTHLIYQTGFASNSYTFSVFAKADGETTFSMWLLNNSVRALFDLSNGTIILSTVTSSKIEDYGNGWYRCSVYSSTAGTTASIYGRNGGAFIGNNSDGILFYGAQLEAGAYPTSYIPTTSSSATRLADTCSKTGISSLIGQTEGVFFYEFDYKYGQINTALFDTSSSPTDNIYLLALSDFRLRMYINVGGVVQVTISTPTIPSEGRHKVALAYKENDCAFYLDGVQVGVDTSCTIPTVDDIYLRPPNQNTRQVVFFKTRLTDAECQTLTTL